ncbi:MAG: hypothetical protein L0K86_21150 [Actinomycetia bacterium]|nr:hypothetical protein [Actinomycetes bacterium]
MSIDRSELHELIDELPDDQVEQVMDDLRRRARPRPARTSEPFAWIGMVDEARNGRTDNAQRVDELLADGFGRS